ncbi:hypothetical protein J6S37_02650 [Candidatus Saccharibacteria bacterium]|nr:hypothetical protein [Candidatus Saccharibacteria bacterium]
MKKLAIAGASLALAAMPVVGVFAATSTSFQDTITVGVSGGCTLEKTGGTAGDYSTNDRTFSGNIPAGNVGYFNATDGTTPPSGSHITVSCNSSSSSAGYVINLAVDGLTDATAGTISGGNAISGATSAWAIQSNATGVEDANNPFKAYAAATNGPFLTANAANTVTFNPSYRVYIAPTQAAGSYVGHATYTINLN